MHNIYKYCQEKTKNRDESHNYEHHCEVKDLALDIYQDFIESESKTNFSHQLFSEFNLENLKEIIEITSILHDIPDHKYCDIVSAENFDPLGLGMYPFEKSIRLLLCNNGFKKYSDIVLSIIDNISYSKEVKGLKQDLGKYEILRNIVSDADKITALGENGIKRCYDYTKVLMPQANDYEIQKHMICHCEEKLNHLIDFIRTKKGKQLAENGQSYVRNWYKNTKLSNTKFD